MGDGMRGRGGRSKKQAERWPEPTEALAELTAGWELEAMEGDRPSPNAPLEVRDRWILEHRGPEALAPEVVEELKERICALPGCAERAARGSLFCGFHQRSALGEAGARELRALNREMERLARIADREDRKLAAAKFRGRVERGDFALLFSRGMRETLAAAGQDLELELELGAIRLSLARVIEEMEDPREMSLAVARLSNAAVRATAANYTMRKRRR